MTNKGGGSHLPSLLSPRRVIARERDKDSEREKARLGKEVHAYSESGDDHYGAIASETNRVFGVGLKSLLEREEGGSLPRIACDLISALSTEGTYFCSLQEVA